ncbi:DVU0524 family FlgM-associated protein [Desulfovibrio ferrophilus]|nr:DVU0524 family FlgM-associated protein [Desulfovibrio ferrophilus]
MLKTYGRQLTSARRLARFKQSLAAAGAEEEVTISRLAKRRMLVEQVAREIVENLIVSGSENEVVLEILQQLNREFGETFRFEYPPAEVDLQIFRLVGEDPMEVTDPERHHVFNRLWEITLERVNDTML